MNPEQIKQKFLSKIKQTTGCWIWMGGETSTGYGIFRWGHKNKMRAHRFSLFIHQHKMPEQFVLHKCDNKLCVNPDHLYEGTQKQNCKDMIERGRHASQKKTHCKKWHQYTMGNTYIHKNGSRRCKKCHSLAAKESIAKVPVWTE